MELRTLVEQWPRLIGMHSVQTGASVPRHGLTHGAVFALLQPPQKLSQRSCLTPKNSVLTAFIVMLS